MLSAVMLVPSDGLPLTTQTVGLFCAVVLQFCLYLCPLAVLLRITKVLDQVAPAGHDSSESLRTAPVSASGLDTTASCQGQSQPPPEEAREAAQPAKSAHEELARQKGGGSRQTPLVSCSPLVSLLPIPLCQ